MKNLPLEKKKMVFDTFRDYHIYVFRYSIFFGAYLRDL